MHLHDILTAIPWGLLLAFSIGPGFFVLLETSITKGFRAAFTLDLGIVFGVTWIVIALIFRYSSLSSILGSMAVWIYSISFANEMQSYFSFFLFVIIFFTHKENIIRLKNSKETKIKI